jgi:putative restriction endonuclease
LSARFDPDLVPASELDRGFEVGGLVVKLRNPQSGIFRPAAMRTKAALSIMTTTPRVGRPAPYEDAFDEQSGTFTYHFRTASTDSDRARVDAARDNDALRAAYEQQEPMIYLRGILPGQFAVIAPVFIVGFDDIRRVVQVEAGLQGFIASSSTAPLPDRDTRAYATRMVAQRLHQDHFRAAVMQAYTTRCAVCSLKEDQLLEAAHIIGDREADGIATVQNGLSLCTIHHRAYDANLIGIAPDKFVHVSERLLNEIDGPMLRNGLQAFHQQKLRVVPRLPADQPDPDRLERRFEEFQEACA